MTIGVAEYSERISKYRLPIMIARVFNKIKYVIITIAILSCSMFSIAEEVTVAGFAFAGDYRTAADRFPFSFKNFQAAKAKNNGSYSMLISERIKIIKNENLKFNTNGNSVSLKNSDQALMAILVLTDEVVVNENFGNYYKTFVNLRGDAIIFDHKSQTIIKNYPVSVALFDATEGGNPPSDSRISSFVDNLIRRDDSNGLISQFVRRMSVASLPKSGEKTFQVKKGEILPEALSLLPVGFRQNPKVANAMLADAFASVLAAKTNISILPNSIGHATGQMNMRLENGDEYQVKIGEGDYLFDVTLKKLAKIEATRNHAEIAYIFGALSRIRFYEPALNTTYLESDFKNGENAIIPVGRIAGEDFAAFNETIVSLFKKFADALAEPGSKWVGTAASAQNIESELKVSRNILGKIE